MSLDPIFGSQNCSILISDVPQCSTYSYPVTWHQHQGSLFILKPRQYSTWTKSHCCAFGMQHSFLSFRNICILSFSAILCPLSAHILFLLPVISNLHRSSKTWSPHPDIWHFLPFTENILNIWNGSLCFTSPILSSKIFTNPCPSIPF